MTGKAFSACVEKYIYQPLGMTRSTVNFPRDDNVVFKHWVDLDGVAHEFSWSNTRGWCDETGFGAAVGARSSTADLLVMYQSLLHAYNHQMNEKVDFTPGSPFRYARHLLSAHIGVGEAALDQQGYCLGTYRSTLPANLSTASYNSILLGKQSQPLFGKKNDGRIVFHQVATFTTYNGVLLMEPQSQTAVFVLVNSLPLFDVTDMVAKLLLGIILGETDQPDYMKIAKSIIQVNSNVYKAYAVGLERLKSRLPTSYALAAYEGDYWNKDGLICYSVRACGNDALQVMVKGSQLTRYHLNHWGGDQFCFVPNRELEVSRSMWPFTSPKTRMFFFNCNREGVVAFIWHHDLTPGSKSETFVKETRSITANL